MSAQSEAVVTSPAPSNGALGPEADRRDSLRVPLTIFVRDEALGGSFEPYPGNLALGGVYFEALHPLAGKRVEVRFVLPGGREEIRSSGEVIEVQQEGATFGTRVRFADLPLALELAIARHLQR